MAQEKKHDITFSALNVSPEMYPRYWETYHADNAYDVPWLDESAQRFISDFQTNPPFGQFMGQVVSIHLADLQLILKNQFIVVGSDFSILPYHFKIVY